MLYTLVYIIQVVIHKIYIISISYSYMSEYTTCIIELYTLCILEYNNFFAQWSLLDNYSYICGSSLQDMELPEPFSEVYVCNINCYDPIEKLYYSAGYTPICIYYAVEVDVDSAFYPQCAHCQKPKIKK